MKATENRSRCYGAVVLDRPMERGILVQRLMDPHVIIVGCKLAKGAAQMGLPEYDHVVNTFPSDRADQSLRVPVLPRRAWSNGLVADAHGS